MLVLIITARKLIQSRQNHINGLILGIIPTRHHLHHHHQHKLLYVVLVPQCYNAIRMFGSSIFSVSPKR